ncbi:glycosyl transferase family 2 [Halococcus saccharolyticus DSM 5350]|uniref:Glycosyl transferase family 2 n=1 Tax=Halococcus saccharolyticus DSM 5350 TaxID=1227455 RepID=M0MNS3_9EURY|nr:glycosyl transferase family 2 [Halococcus saccharolyticus DSM 5350]
MEFAAAYFLLAVGIGVVLSWLSIYSEVWGYRQYDHPRQQIWLLAASLVENLASASGRRSSSGAR